MTFANTSNKIYQFISIIFILLLVSPMLISTANLDGKYKFSTYESHQNEEQNNENEPENKEEKTFEEIILSDSYNTEAFYLLTTNYLSFNFKISKNDGIEIFTPPPEFLT